MSVTKSNRIKKLAVSTAMVFLLGGGATAALVVPGSSSAALAKHGVDGPGHVRGGGDGAANHAMRGADDRAPEAKHAANHALGRHAQGADDAAGHVRHGGADDLLPHA
jgi:hypothetical protein